VQWSASTVRQQFCRTEAALCGYVALAGSRRRTPVAAALHDTLLHHMIFCFSDDGVALSIPMPTPVTALRRARAPAISYWFRAADYEKRCLSCARMPWPPPRRHDNRHPDPARIGERAEGSARRTCFREVAALVAARAAARLQPVFELECPSDSHSAGVALLGDAAFVARPHVATA